MAETITVEMFEEWTDSNWFTYSSSLAKEKKFKARIGYQLFRVFHGKELVWETRNLQEAVEVYNSITTKPTNEPKLDN